LTPSGWTVAGSTVTGVVISTCELSGAIIGVRLDSGVIAMSEGELGAGVSGVEGSGVGVGSGVGFGVGSGVG
jgi:hypothetical protein